MEWMPGLKIGWLNGWLALALLVLTDGILFSIFPKQVMARLFDRSGWSQKQVAFTVAGKLCALSCLILIILTPLKTGSHVLTIGAIAVALGLIGLIKALFDFKNTPLDEPVTRGLYKLSRHSQNRDVLARDLGGLYRDWLVARAGPVGSRQAAGTLGDFGGRRGLSEAVWRGLSCLPGANAALFCVLLMPETQVTMRLGRKRWDCKTECYPDHRRECRI